MTMPKKLRPVTLAELRKAQKQLGKILDKLNEFRTAWSGTTLEDVAEDGEGYANPVDSGFDRLTMEISARIAGIANGTQLNDRQLKQQWTHHVHEQARRNEKRAATIAAKAKPSAE
jgi:hypothetical protein